MLVDLTTGAARLNGATKALKIAWEQTTDEWNDETSRAFEDNYLEPLFARVKTAVDATSRMAELLARVQRDCEP